jgi:hypothetical protein
MFKIISLLLALSTFYINAEDTWPEGYENKEFTYDCVDMENKNMLKRVVITGGHTLTITHTWFNNYQDDTDGINTTTDVLARDKTKPFISKNKVRIKGTDKFSYEYKSALIQTSTNDKIYFSYTSVSFDEKMQYPMFGTTNTLDCTKSF